MVGANRQIFKRDVLKAVLAGALGGLVGTWTKFGWDTFWPPRPAGRLPEPQVLLSLFTHQPSSIQASHTVSFIFSICFGMLYGVSAEFLPYIAFADGLLFGFAIWLGAHELIMPLIGLTPPTWKLSANEQFAELFGHLVWGLVIGVFCRIFRTSRGFPRVRHTQVKA